MAFQLSAGVNVSEIDLTTVIPSVATSTGAFVGPFAWGPCSEVTTISDETRLVSTFGKPNSDNYEYWFSAANFLAYGNNLKILKVDMACVCYIVILIFLSNSIYTLELISMMIIF